MNKQYEKECFVAALKHHAGKMGHGARKEIGNAVGLSSSFIGQLIKEGSNKDTKFENKERIAIYLMGSFEKFINFGHLLIKNKQNQNTINSKPFQNGSSLHDNTFAFDTVERKCLRIFKRFANQKDILDLLNFLADLETLDIKEYERIRGEVRGIVKELKTVLPISEETNKNEPKTEPASNGDA